MSKSKGKKQMSEKALAANLANAQKSTGPKTPPSAEDMGQRALKHGLTAQVVEVLPWESLEELKAFTQAMLDTLDPVGIREVEVAVRIVKGYWRLRRTMTLEAMAAQHSDDQDFLKFLNQVLFRLERYHASIARNLARDESRLAMLQYQRQKADGLSPVNPSLQKSAGSTRPPVTSPPSVQVPSPVSPKAAPSGSSSPKKGKYGNLNAWAHSFETQPRAHSPLPATTPPQNGFDL